MMSPMALGQPSMILRASRVLHNLNTLPFPDISLADWRVEPANSISDMSEPSADLPFLLLADEKSLSLELEPELPRRCSSGF